MKIRFKLLFLLLAVSIIPLAVIQTGIMDSLHSLSNEIGTEMKAEMIRKSSTELKRLVEDHARILNKQRKIIELNLEQLSSELTKWIEADGTYITPKVVSFNNDDDTDLKDINKNFQIKKFKIKGSNEILDHYDFRFDSVRYTVPSYWSEKRIVPDDKTSQILPLLKTVEIRNPNMSLWIKVQFTTGETLTYPNQDPISSAVGHANHMHNGMGSMMGMSMNPASNDIKRSLNGTPQWSLPYTDPVTGRTVITASLGVLSSKGKPYGSVSIDVPLDVLLQGYNHLKAYSDNISFLITRLKKLDDGNKSIEIAAEETTLPSRESEGMMHMWQSPVEKSLQGLASSEDIAKFIDMLSKGKSGVLNMPYKGQNSIWAFSPPSERETSLLLVLPQKDVTKPAEMTNEFIKDTITKQSSYLIMILSVVTLAVFILAFMFSRKFTANILVLARGVKRITSGDFSAHVDIQTSDEIGELAEDFNKMVPKLQEHIEIKSALNVAMEVQENLLPQEPPITEHFDIFGYSKYCDEIGGDYFDYLTSGNDKECIRFIVGDVSGHGVPAAILMGSIRGYIHARNLSKGSLGELLTDINKLIAADTYKTSQFMTMMAVEMNLITGAISWVRAGHDPAILYDSDTSEFTELNGEGIALGLMDDTEFMENNTHKLNPNQILVLGTDGIWEASNPDGDFFGKERLKNIIASNGHCSSKEIASEVFRSVEKFTGKVSQEDDLTLMIIKRLNN